MYSREGHYTYINNSIEAAVVVSFIAAELNTIVSIILGREEPPSRLNPELR